MNSIYKRSYQAVVNRGKITPFTPALEFIEKIKEETAEAEELIKDGTITDLNRYAEEITDTMSACINQLVHLGLNPEKELLKVIEKNENRND